MQHRIVIAAFRCGYVDRVKVLTVCESSRNTFIALGSETIFEMYVSTALMTSIVNSAGLSCHYYGAAKVVQSDELPPIRSGKLVIKCVLRTEWVQSRTKTDA